jgi:DNA-binding protein H-NS
MAKLADLLAQKAALEKQIAQTQRAERGAAIAKVKALMEEYGLTAADLSLRKPASALPKKKPTRKVPPKFRNKATGETWSGRGLQPRWLKAALADGRQLADFAV